ncbi:OmpA family protein [Azospirillum agricola]|uniref:OmpA family protein n=1 Tax=Azospirillum agricola TaxID=1720247 RepID=UPI000A0F32F3|nr:OmpA family protein [Azospirillum agricola]SMH31931.1 Outer membrane protein OmpA [Azospirillum lipoferum]
MLSKPVLLALAVGAALTAVPALAEVTDLTGGVPKAARIIDALAPPEPAVRAKGIGAPKDLQVEERRIRLDIPFANNSAELTGSARQTLAELAAALTSPRLAGARIVIEGHANRTGTADHNRWLTGERAAAVSRILYSGGVTAGRLSATGFGFDRPIPGIKPTDGRNRRVEIVAVP